MARQGKNRSHFWRLLRIYFRRFRITVLLALLALLSVVIYLNQHGLPDFVKRPVLEALRARGLDLEFSRMRLRLYRGIVAENVRFGGIEEPALPRLTAKEVEIDVNLRALARLQLQVDSLGLRGGNLTWTVAETNAPARTLTVSDIETTLRLMPGDEWRLEDFRAQFAGARFFLSGIVTNASAVRDWRLARRQQPGSGPQWPERLRRLAETLERISFSSPPELRLTLDGDALDLQSFTARLTLSAPDADTPWGKASNVLLTSRLFPGAGRELSHLELHLRATTANTRWADAAQLDLELNLDTSSVRADLVDGTLSLRAASAQTKWAEVTNAHFTADWVHSMTNPIPISGSAQLRAATANTRWGNAGNVRFAARFDAAADSPVLRSRTTTHDHGKSATAEGGQPTDASWAWWTNLQPYQVEWDGELTGLQSEKLVAEKISCAGQWRTPVFVITNVHAQLHDGAVTGHAALNMTTREASFGAVSDFDVQKISPLLTPGVQRWLTRYTFPSPPRVRGSGAATLPAWTNLWRGRGQRPEAGNQTSDLRPPPSDLWRAEVLPTLRLAGEFAVTNGAFRGVAASLARSHFSYTNMIWHLPDIEVARPEGQLRIVHVSDDRTKEFYFQVHGAIDPQALRPVLSTNAQRGLDYFTFSQPPVVDGKIRGYWRQPDSISFEGSLALTNFAFREQAADSVVSQVRYTNRVLEFIEPRLWRGTQAMSAAGITADFKTQRIHFTNGFSTAEPMMVARGIGPKAAHGFEPYRFTQPPTVRVNGYVPLKNMEDVDLRFAVEGGPFEWWKFRVPRIAGDVHWLNGRLILTNVQSEFYWGNATGQAEFDLNPEPPGTDFNFAVTAANVNLAMLMADLYARTNQLEGWLSGQLAITNANSADSNSWRGYGRAGLKDGLLWQIPVFGVLSKPLDSMLPGLGNSRVTEAKARFKIADGVIHSDNLEMRALAMRLQYEGQVTLDGRVDARVEAELLRDTWFIGRVVSLALWPVTKMFEYKITGTLENPKSEPLYIPKLLLAPLNPFQTLEDLFTTERKDTDAPPVFKEP